MGITRRSWFVATIFPRSEGVVRSAYPLWATRFYRQQQLKSSRPFLSRTFWNAAMVTGGAKGHSAQRLNSASDSIGVATDGLLMRISRDSSIILTMSG